MPRNLRTFEASRYCLQAVGRAERRHAPGETPMRGVKALRKAAMDWYPTSSATDSVPSEGFLRALAAMLILMSASIRAGKPTGDSKRDALVAFVSKLQLSRGTLSQSDFEAIRAAQYTETQLADISLAIALTIFTNTFNRINDTNVDSAGEVISKSGRA